MENNPQKITLDDISPIIRFSQQLTVQSRSDWGELIAYDNRLFLCTDGEGDLVISNIAYPIKRGTIILWQAGASYYYAPKSGSHMTFLGFNFDFTNQSQDLLVAIPPAKKDTYYPSKRTEYIKFADFTVLNQPLILQGLQYTENYFRSIDKEFTYKKKFFMKRCSYLLSALLIIILRATETPLPQDSTNTADCLLSYIHDNYAQNVTNESLSNAFGYHAGHLNRLMKNATGMSMHQYLLNYRIERAIAYLQSEHKTVSETCYLCGFKDLAHFSKCFKLKTGYPPSHYYLKH